MNWRHFENFRFGTSRLSPFVRLSCKNISFATSKRLKVYVVYVAEQLALSYIQLPEYIMSRDDAKSVKVENNRLSKTRILHCKVLALIKINLDFTGFQSDGIFLNHFPYLDKHRLEK